MQLARQQQDLEQRARQSGNAQGMQSEQGALQQGVQQAAERLEKAGRNSSLLSAAFAEGDGRCAASSATGHAADGAGGLSPAGTSRRRTP